MLDGRLRTRLLFSTVIALGTWALLSSDAGPSAAQDVKKEGKDDKKKDKRGGTVVGTLTKKGDNFVEVKADGEEKARRYVPRWVGGLPAKGGGFDKKVLETFKKLKEGSRVRLEWEFEERPRVLRIEMLKAPAEGKK
jgi:hypothetical protein